MHWGYLLDEFANSLTNFRKDEYGGSLENRTRIMKELREAIAEKCGRDFPVTVRLGLRSYLKDVNHGDVTGEHVGTVIRIKLLDRSRYPVVIITARKLHQEFLRK